MHEHVALRKDIAALHATVDSVNVRATEQLDVVDNALRDLRMLVSQVNGKSVSGFHNGTIDGITPM